VFYIGILLLLKSRSIEKLSTTFVSADDIIMSTRKKIEDLLTFIIIIIIIILYWKQYVNTNLNEAAAGCVCVYKREIYVTPFPT